MSLQLQASFNSLWALEIDPLYQDWGMWKWRNFQDAFREKDELRMIKVYGGRLKFLSQHKMYTEGELQKGIGVGSLKIV